MKNVYINARKRICSNIILYHEMKRLHKENEALSHRYDYLFNHTLKLASFLTRKTLNRDTCVGVL